MNCPYPDCGYTHLHEKSLSEKGEFFTLSNDIKADRPDPKYEYVLDTREVMGCPKCNRLFMVEN